jgi:hypothetical protein
MKHVKLFEKFISEKLDHQAVAQRVMQELDTFGQLHPQYQPKEVLNTIEGVLKKYKSLYGGKLIQKVGSEIRDELGETGNLANDAYRHIKDVDHIIMNALEGVDERKDTREERAGAQQVRRMTRTRVVPDKKKEWKKGKRKHKGAWESLKLEDFKRSIQEKYTEDDINMGYGFFRNVLDAEIVKREQDAIDLFDGGVMALQRAPYRLTEEEALDVLNSVMGRHAADQIVSGEANTAILGLEQYYGKKLRSEIAKVQRLAVNEDLRSDLKKYIKKNKKELDLLADQDDWDGIYRMLMNDFEVEDGSDDAEDLKQTFNFVY